MIKRRLLKDADFESWVNDIKSEIDFELTDENINDLKQYYQKNGNRDYNISKKIAIITVLKSKISKDLIVVGWNKTRYGKSYLVCYDKQTDSLVTVGGNITDIVNDIVPMELIKVSGSEKNGKIIATKFERIGISDFSELKFITDSDLSNMDIKAGDKFLLLKTSNNVNIFEPIDWDNYDREVQPLSDAPRREMLDKGKASFTVSYFIGDNTSININFREIPIRFFSDIVLEGDLESSDSMQIILSEIPFIIPIYITKDPSDMVRMDGSIITAIRATGFGILKVPEDLIDMEVQSGKSIVAKSDEENDLVQIMANLLEQYDTVSVNVLKSETETVVGSEISEEDFDESLKELCKRGIGVMVDPETVMYAVKKKDVDDSNNEDESEW